MLELKPEGLLLADTVSRPLAMCGQTFIADHTGALYWPSQSALLVADLHLQSGPAGNGARRTLVALAEAMDRYEPARVIVLGDGELHGPAAPPMSAEDLQILRILQEDREWTWIAGHDAPHNAGMALQLGGSACGELKIAGIALRHRPTRGWATHEIGAHLRPAAHLSLYGYSIRRACFVGNRQRLVMPAFGAPARGLNVLDGAFQPLFGNGGMAVWMLGQEGLYPVATRFLVED